MKDKKRISLKELVFRINLLGGDDELLSLNFSKRGTYSALSPNTITSYGWGRSSATTQILCGKHGCEAPAHYLAEKIVRYAQV